MSSVQMFEDVLRKACKATGFSYDRLVYPQLAAGQRSVSTQQAFDLVALAEVARHEPPAPLVPVGERRRLCRLPGRRSPGTAFLDRLRAVSRAVRASRPLRVRLGAAAAARKPGAGALRDPRAPAGAAAGYRGDTSAGRTPTPQRRGASSSHGCRAWQRWTLRPRVRWTLRRLKQQYVWREAVRSDLTRVVSRVRAWHLVLADRFVERGWIDRRDDYFLLQLDEVKRAGDRSRSRAPACARSPHEPRRAAGRRARPAACRC